MIRYSRRPFGRFLARGVGVRLGEVANAIWRWGYEPLRQAGPEEVLDAEWVWLCPYCDELEEVILWTDVYPAEEGGWKVCCPDCLNIDWLDEGEEVEKRFPGLGAFA